MTLKVHDNNQESIVDGIRVPRLFDIDLFRSGLQYKAQPDDIFITTYPRSGTHWMSIIVYSLLTNGQPFDKDIGDYLARLPFLDRFGKDAAMNMTRPGAIQTHYPFDHIPYDSQAKYICVIREPKDVCVSFYRLVTENSAFEFPKIDFNSFFELFITGQTPYINFFDHLRMLWSHKDDDNVLLVSYEQMQQNLREMIQKVAGFLGMDVTKDDQLLDRVETYASFDYMKKHFDATRTAFREQQGQPSSHLVKFIRKGIVGDWSSCMTEEQRQRFDAVTAEKTADMAGLEAFWHPQSDVENHE